MSESNPSPAQPVEAAPASGGSGQEDYGSGLYAVPMSSAPNPQPAPPLDLDQFAGYTPGPLKVARAFRNNYPDYFVVQPALEFRTRAWGKAVMAECGNEQDARLYAAAPALLAECHRQRDEIARLRSMLPEVAARDRKNVPCYCDAFAIGKVTHTDRCSEIARAALAQTAPDGQGGA